MRPKITIVFALLLAFALGACRNKIDPEEEAILNDKIPPLLLIAGGESEVIIWQGEPIDLMRGITGLDNLEGNITHRIQINAGDYDPNVPGRYEILYFLSDRAGNTATPFTRIITVRNATILAPAPIYMGDIPNEIPPPTAPACFQGAWYHKVFSAKDRWMGIEGTITLPSMNLDRYEGTYDTTVDLDFNARNLDNPSVYMGGHAITESDIGLSLSRVCLGEDCTLSTGGLAFRPFWRYIAKEDLDEGPYHVHNNEYAVSCRAQGTAGYYNCIANWHFNDTQYYYLPGDTLRMLVYSPEPNYLQMQIEVIEKSTLPASMKIRADNGWADPANFFSPPFRSPGHGTNMNIEYKRVNAIDQVANEGLPSIETMSYVREAVWHEVYLYRNINEVMHRVPFTDARSTTMNCPIDDRFTVTKDGVNADLGGTVVRIHPAGPDAGVDEMTPAMLPRKEDEE